MPVKASLNTHFLCPQVKGFQRIEENQSINLTTLGGLIYKKNKEGKEDKDLMHKFTFDEVFTTKNSFCLKDYIDKIIPEDSSFLEGNT